MERSDTLYARVDEADTETPRACHIVALKLAQAGVPIPEDVGDAVISSAERGKEILGSLIAAANEENVGEYTDRENFLRLAAQIAFSYGINGPEACQRRLNNLYVALSADESSGEGVGFTE